MTSPWSLPLLFQEFHKEIEQALSRAQSTLAHPTDKGDASEAIWLDVLNKYLPNRYAVRKGHVVDSKGNFSGQIDIIIHDQQYSPFVFRFRETDMVPAESVYAVFEAKQYANSQTISYARDKIATVRKLHRTSLAVNTIDGERAAKPLHHIIGGLVTLGSSWKPPLGDSFQVLLGDGAEIDRLDIGCVAKNGLFTYEGQSEFRLCEIDKSATRFLFELIARLQTIGTVPMLDVRAYAAMI